ncbi:hypothetical protein ACWCOV_41520 [Kribbella sp. NPDC002412]
MPPSSTRNSPPDPSGGENPHDLYDELTDDLLYDPAVGRSTIMGHPCVRLAGRFLASYDAKTGHLVVKLPAARVAELVATGTGQQFAPAGKAFREWVAIPVVEHELWQSLLAEAVAFARQCLGGKQ